MRSGCALALTGTTAAAAAGAVIDRAPSATTPDHRPIAAGSALDMPISADALRTAAGAMAALSDTITSISHAPLMARAADAANGFDGYRTTALASRAAHRGMRPATWHGGDVYAAEVKYHEDFESRSLGREWSVPQISAMTGLSRFAGPFRNQASTVNVAVTEGQSYAMSVDICFVATRLGTPDASDLLRITIDGEVRFETTIAALVAERAAQLDADPEANPHVYPNLIIPFRADYAIAEIVIESIAAGEPGGEMWGFDNVMIDTTPKLMASVFGEDGAPTTRAYGGGGGFSPGAPGTAGRSFGPGAFSEGPGGQPDPDTSLPKFPFIDSNPFVEEPRLPLEDPITPEFDPYTPSQPSDPPTDRPPTDEDPPIDRTVPPDVPTPGVLMVAPLALAMGLRRRR
jgi:hypothetical protein